MFFTELSIFEKSGVLASNVTNIPVLKNPNKAFWSELFDYFVLDENLHVEILKKIFF